MKVSSYKYSWEKSALSQSIVTKYRYYICIKARGCIKHSVGSKMNFNWQLVYVLLIFKGTYESQFKNSDLVCGCEKPKKTHGNPTKGTCSVKKGLAGVNIRFWTSKCLIHRIVIYPSYFLSNVMGEAIFLFFKKD